MTLEIERKFLVKKMPDLSGLTPVHYERHFLRMEKDYEERIQKKGDHYELGKKNRQSQLTRTTEKREISKEKYENLREHTIASLARRSYLISTDPEITLKIYEGVYEGLCRAEVEFLSETAAKAFVPLDWMGKEITNTPLGKDSKLITLERGEFLQLL